MTADAVRLHALGRRAEGTIVDRSDQCQRLPQPRHIGFNQLCLASHQSGHIATEIPSVGGIITSPWGKRSGAHMNPSVTLSFLLLRKLEAWDAVFYVLSQFLGGIAGVALANLLIGVPLSHAAVDYVVTVPGSHGVGAAFC